MANKYIKGSYKWFPLTEVGEISFMGNINESVFSDEKEKIESTIHNVKRVIMTIAQNSNMKIKEEDIVITYE